jgi:hypothetical protein
MQKWFVECFVPFKVTMRVVEKKIEVNQPRD